MELAFSLSGTGGKEKTWPRLSWNYSCCLLTWTPEPTDAANKECLLNWDPCHQSGLRIIFNSRLGREVVEGGVTWRESKRRQKNEEVLSSLQQYSIFGIWFETYLFHIIFIYLGFSPLHIAVTLSTSHNRIFPGHVYEYLWFCLKNKFPNMNPGDCSFPLSSILFIVIATDLPLILLLKKKWGWSHWLVLLSKSS